MKSWRGKVEMAHRRVGAAFLSRMAGAGGGGDSLGPPVAMLRVAWLAAPPCFKTQKHRPILWSPLCSYEMPVALLYHVSQEADWDKLPLAA
jgi:hypothetical protein